MSQYLVSFAGKRSCRLRLQDMVVLESNNIEAVDAPPHFQSYKFSPQYSKAHQFILLLEGGVCLCVLILSINSTVILLYVFTVWQEINQWKIRLHRDSFQVSWKIPFGYEVRHFIAASCTEPTIFYLCVSNISLRMAWQLSIWHQTIWLNTYGNY